MPKRRDRPPELPSPRAGRDRAADRALFERALETLDHASDESGRARLGYGPAEEKDREVETSARVDRRARFARRVARDEVEPAAVLDLHGLDRATATDRLRRFLSTAPGEAVLVVHGRGLGILEAAAVAELDRHPRVGEHLPAPGRLGGSGARLARLR